MTDRIRPNRLNQLKNKLSSLEKPLKVGAALSILLSTTACNFSDAIEYASMPIIIFCLIPIGIGSLINWSAQQRRKEIQAEIEKREKEFPNEPYPPGIGDNHN